MLSAIPVSPANIAAAKIFCILTCRDVIFVLCSHQLQLKIQHQKYQSWISITNEHNFLIFWHRMWCLCQISGECALHSCFLKKETSLTCWQSFGTLEEHFWWNLNPQVRQQKPDKKAVQILTCSAQSEECHLGRGVVGSIRRRRGRKKFFEPKKPSKSPSPTPFCSLEQLKPNSCGESSH